MTCLPIWKWVISQRSLFIKINNTCYLSENRLPPNGLCYQTIEDQDPFKHLVDVLSKMCFCTYTSLMYSWRLYNHLNHKLEPLNST